MTTPDLCTRLDITLGPDPRRVIVKLFLPGTASRWAWTRHGVVGQRQPGPKAARPAGTLYSSSAMWSVAALPRSRP